MSTDDDQVAQRLLRWEERDAVVGLTAELEQLAARLDARDCEVVQLRERGERLAQRVAQLTVERDVLARQVARLQRPTVGVRVVGRARRTVGGALRRAGLR